MLLEQLFPTLHDVLTNMFRPMMYNIHGTANISTPHTEYFYITIY